MIVSIDGNRLIDLLENEFGNIFGNIKEGDVITDVQLIGSDVKITIGDDDND